MAKPPHVAKERASFDVLKQLRELIAKEYRDGGTLPNQTTMCQLLGVSNKTYLKAIQYLITDGSVSTGKGKTGTRVMPDFVRARKVGIVIQNGKDSPFIQNGRILGALISRFEAQGYCTQLLQAPAPDKLSLKALQHGTRAVVWFNPIAATIPAMQRLAQEHPLLLMAHKIEPALQKSFTTDLPFVASRQDQPFELLLQTMHHHHAQRLVIVGSRSSLQASNCIQILQKGGIQFTEECCIERSDLATRLLETIVKNRVDTVYANGGGIVYYPLMELLDRLPRQQRPLVFADQATNYSPNPRVESKISGYIEMEMEPIGVMAAEILIKHIEKGVPLKTTLLACHRFRCNDVKEKGKHQNSPPKNRR